MRIGQGSAGASPIAPVRPSPPKPAAPASATAARGVQDSFEKARVSPFATPAARPTGAAAPQAQVTEAQVLEALRSGKTDAATRQMIADYFGPLGMDASHATMETIRQEGLLDVFIQATVRDSAGNPPGPELTAGLTRLLETGRLDVYAETLATTAINVGDYGGKLEYRPAESAVVLDRNSLGDTQNLANVLAHELFHAFADAHGGGQGALNEGFGIAAREYAFTDGQYNLAEMVYGTKNWYRDREGQPNYPIGDMGNADGKLREFLGAMAARDSSLLAWQNPAQMQQEYRDYFAPINRDQDWNAWLAEVDDATRRMLDARGENRVPRPEGAAPAAPKNPLEAIIDWFKRLLGL